jgi:hypothetical protein
MLSLNIFSANSSFISQKEFEKPDNTYKIITMRQPKPNQVRDNPKCSWIIQPESVHTTKLVVYEDRILYLNTRLSEACSARAQHHTVQNICKRNSYIEPKFGLFINTVTTTVILSRKVSYVCDAHHFYALSQHMQGYSKVMKESENESIIAAYCSFNLYYHL